MFRILPSARRSDGRLPYRTAMPRLTLSHLAHRTGGHCPRPQPLVLPLLSLAGLTTLLPCGAVPDHQDSIVALWQLLARDLVGSNAVTDETVVDMAEVTGEQAAVTKGSVWGVLRYPEAQEEARYLYAAAVQTASPPLLVPTLVVPPGRYIRCELLAYSTLPMASGGVSTALYMALG